MLFPGIKHLDCCLAKNAIRFALGCWLLLSLSSWALPAVFEKPAKPLIQRDARLIGEAELALKAKDYPKALPPYLFLAVKKKNPFAQYQVGYFYLHGLGLDKDSKRAFFWFKKAADQKLPEAQFALGLMYFYGLGVTQDLSRAVSLFQESVLHTEQANYAPAAYMLGYFSSVGYGLPRDPAAALDWYGKAAALNFPPAQYNLALLYYHSEAYAKAFPLFLSAAKQHCVKAEFMTGLMYSLGQGVAEDKVQAASWYAQAAAAGLDVAQYNLGVMYFSGEDLPLNRPFGLQMISKAAMNGLGLAEYLMGYISMNGMGIPADPAAGLQWYQKAAQQGLGEAQFALGYYYYKGLGVEADPRQALTWFYAAAKSGIVNAQYMLGLFYQQGIAVASDKKMAAYWYNLAALQGMENAQLMLGLMYAQGEGVPRNNQLAYAWFNLAAASQNPAFHTSVLQVREEVGRSMGQAEILLAKQMSEQLDQKIKMSHAV